MKLPISANMLRNNSRNAVAVGEMDIEERLAFLNSLNREILFSRLNLKCSLKKRINIRVKKRSQRLLRNTMAVHDIPKVDY